MGILCLELSYRLLVQQGVIFIDLIDASKIANIQKVHTGACQCINRVIIIQNGLLFLVPFRLSWKHADVVEPVGARLKTNDFDVFVA